jgi:hypothetical protein
MKQHEWNWGAQHSSHTIKVYFPSFLINLITGRIHAEQALSISPYLSY